MSKSQFKRSEPKNDCLGLQSHQWLLSYKTSSTKIDGRPVDMLHDFYIPAVSLAERYDRVAGYFRSSSLAAASQGFSAFVGRGGKMRLIVGADLQPEDVRAILEGDRQRLELCLNEQLTSTESWPAEVRNGVELLAWIVARGYLEVRVAIRVHGETGQPLPMDSIVDGYVHEKWLILYDQFGQRLYGSGSLNESKTALVMNGENIEVHCDWWGDIEHRRVEEAAAAFENLWRGQVPHMPVYTLPDAVERRLVQIAEQVKNPVEIDGSSAAVRERPIPSAMECLQFAMLRDAPKLPGGRFVGMETAPVAPWPHQEVVVRRLVETWPYTYLLCDEVGLGKTIEAGLAFRSLYLSGLVKRILVAAPASLTRQWHRQMAMKLLLSFGRTLPGASARHEYIFPEDKELESSSIYEPNLVIISTGLLTRPNRRGALDAAEPFDVALLDEAHAARRQNPAKGAMGNPVFGHLYDVISNHLRSRARSLWLATATPMQIDPVEVCDLLALTNRAGAFQFDPTLTLQYYDILAKSIHSEGLRDHEWSFLRRAVSTLRYQDPLLWQFLEDSVIDGRLRMTVRQWLEHGHNPRGSDQELMGRLIFSASPLSRVMLRHSRRLLEIYREQGQLQENLPKREILAIPRILFNNLEKDVYDQLEIYCDGLARQIKEHGDGQTKHALGFLLSFIRLRFASSLFALRETLKRRLVKVDATLQKQLSEEDENIEMEYTLEDLVYEEEMEDDALAVKSLLKNRTPADLQWEKEQLETLLERLTDITGPSSKMLELLKALDKRRLGQNGRLRQTVIFTRFYDTLTDIVTRLRQVSPQVLIGTFSGQGGKFYDPDLKRMCSVNREEVKERFLRGELDLLVCTDAAAEGLNLQTADLLVNFDLGWNPMKVEQRIGRIDRIGQRHAKILVLNLCYNGSAEEIVYKRLLSRLASANLIVGTQQFSLLPVTPEDFQQLAEGTLSPEALFNKAQERMELQRKRAESMEIPPQELYSIYMRLSKSNNHITAPLGLPEIWQVLSESQYLSELGCTTSLSEEGMPIIILAGITGVESGTVLTVSRDLYEKGLPGAETSVRFASYGDPVFEAVLRQVCVHKLPDCVQRIAVEVPGMNEVTVVGYAAACHSPDGNREARLITSWDDLKGLNLAEGDALSEPELEPLRKQLAFMARREFDHYGAAERVERENIRAGIGQELLNYMVIHSLLRSKAKFAGEDALFWPVLDEVEKLFHERELVQVDVAPADLLRPIATDLLFKLNLPKIGEQAFVETTPILGKSACDAARRQAESMKKRKADLSAELVLARLKRESTGKSKQLERMHV